MTKFELTDLPDFELAHIFECGQCFRWKKQNQNEYVGVVKNGVIAIEKKKNGYGVESEGLSEEEIREYFDLNQDYSAIKKQLCREDQYLKLASEYGYGIRILNQDPWETLISFIISAANNIPRISKTIENLANAYGKKIFFHGKEYFLFPTPEELSKASIQELRMLNLGFRDKYVREATSLVLEKKIDLKEISNLPYLSAKKELLKISGVGEKVADCILLFSMKKKEAFPVDTWIKKVMLELYVDTGNTKKITKYAEEKFGEYAGIAQQYLFYWKRQDVS